MHKHTFTKFLLALSTIFVLARSASADTINLMWDPNPEPEVIGYKVHVGTQSGTYTQHIDVGQTTAWSFAGAVAGQQYCFAVTAYVSGMLEGPRSNEVCGLSNWPPVLTDPGAQSSTVGQPDSLQLVGSDPGGEVLTYNATGLPPGLTVMTSTGYVSGTPTTAGSYSVSASASDGVLTASRTFTWTVSAADTIAPVVTITGPTSAVTYATAAMTLALTGTASDNTGVTQVTWVNSRGGTGTASGTTSWSVPSIALQTGSNTLTVTARDAAGNSSFDTLTVTVTVNGAPTLASVPNQSSAINLATTLQLAGSDPNGNALTYSATGLPAGLAVTATSGLISGTPTAAGTYNVTASVSDGSLSASRAFTWTITTADTTAPTVVITSPTTAATFRTTSATMTLGGTASDNVGVTQVSWANNRGGSGSATGTTSWSTAVTLQTGANVLTVTARDAAGNTKAASITVTLNTPPTLSAVANQTVARGAAASVQLRGADADGDALTYGANGLPPGLAIAVSTGLISGTPTVAGSYPVTVTVSDGLQTATQTFTWTVTASTDGVALVTITAPTSATTLSTSAATLSLGGTASASVGVTQVTWVNSRGGSGTATGTTNWSASVALQAGSNVLTVTARDAAGNTSSDVLTVTFGNPLRVASLTANRTAPQPLGTTVTFTAAGAGGNGTYEYQWRVFDGEKWVTKSNWNSNNTLVWTPAMATSDYQVRVIVRSAGKTAMSTMGFPIIP